MTTISFKCPPTILQHMDRIMHERYIDRSSVIKLSLYLLSLYLRKPEIEELDLFELIEHIENENSEEHISFSQFTEH